MFIKNTQGETSPFVRNRKKSGGERNRERENIVSFLLRKVVNEKRTEESKRSDSNGCL